MVITYEYETFFDVDRIFYDIADKTIDISYGDPEDKKLRRIIVKDAETVERAQQSINNLLYNKPDFIELDTIIKSVENTTKSVENTDEDDFTFYAKILKEFFQKLREVK